MEKPYESWILEEVSRRWIAPVSYPDDGNFYAWDEPTLSWVLMVDRNLKTEEQNA